MSGNNQSARPLPEDGDHFHPDNTAVAGRPVHAQHNSLLRTQEALDAARYERPSPTHSFEMDDSAVLMPDAATGQMRYQSHSQSQSRAGSLFGSGILRDDGSRLQHGVKRSPLNGVAKHTLGLFLLGCVVFLWTLSNFLGSSIFADSSYAKPFFLTYLNTSTFTIVMIPSFLKGTLVRYRTGTLRSEVSEVFSLRTLSYLLRGPQTSASNRSLHSRLQNGTEESESEAFLKPDVRSERGSSIRSASPILHSLSSTSAANPFKHDDALRRSSLTSSTTENLPLLPTARLALAFALLWFGANYFAMSCLQHTTVASTTILASTSSVWTLVIGVATKTEKFTWRKLCGVLGSLVGIALTSSADFAFASPEASRSNVQSRDYGLNVRAIDAFPDKPSSEMALGDAMALLSAVIYGAYTITLKRSTLSAYPQSLHMPTFFGLVGLFNMVLLLPGFPLLHVLGVETFAFPPTFHIWAVLLLNSISSLMSDVLWAYAMMFTGPLVVTVGLSLTIPLSLIGEMLIQSKYEGWIYWMGACVVVGSFVFVEREEVSEEDTDDVLTIGSDGGSGPNGHPRPEKDKGNKNNPDVEQGVLRSNTSINAGANVHASGSGGGRDGLNAHTDLVGLLSDDSEDEDDRRRDHFQSQIDGSDPYAD